MRDNVGHDPKRYQTVAFAIRWLRGIGWMHSANVRYSSCQNDGPRTTEGTMMMRQEEIATELEEIKAEIRRAVDHAKELLHGAGGVIDERARRTWVAHIEMALDRDHEWMGGGDQTMQDTIHELVTGEAY